MNRIIVRFALCALLIALCSSAAAQQPKRLGYLTSTDPAYESFRRETIRQALRELGYIEGQNIAIEYRYAEGKMDRLPELAADLLRLKVDVIIAAGGDGVIRAPKNASNTIPIVMTGQGSDPVGAGLVESLARPGGNVTGVTNLLVELGDKRLELLKEAVPKIVRVAVLYVPGDRTHGLELKEVQTASRALGMTIQAWEVRGTEDFNKVFVAMSKQRPDGLHVLGGPVMRDNRKRIIGFVLKNRLPAVYDTRVKQIGLTIPPNVLARADKVIK